MSAEWRALKAGDTVRIIAPAAKSKNFWEELEKCCEFLRKLQLKPFYSDRISPRESSSKNFYDFANADEERYLDFADALQSDAPAIWCFRGGYGTDRVLRHAIERKLLPPRDAKLFIGFSDITNLHSYLNNHWHWSTLHGPSLKQLGLDILDQTDVDTTLKIIFGKMHEVRLPLTPMNNAAKSKMEITSQMTGGNLITIQSAIGTPWQMPVQDKIILFEDIDEAPYRIARVFQHFLASEQLQGARAIVLGDFIEAGGKNTEFMDFALREFAELCPLPVLRYAGIGHGKRNHPIPLGTEARLNLGPQAELVIAAGTSA